MSKPGHINLGSNDSLEKYKNPDKYRSHASTTHVRTHARNNNKPKGRLIDNFSATEPNFQNSTSNNNMSYKTAQYSRHSDSKYSHKHIKSKKRAKKRKALYTTCLVLIIMTVIGVAVWKFFPIKVTINGQEQTLTYDKSLGEAIAQSNIKVNPGNFIAVDDKVLKNGEGYEYYSEINGEEVLDKSTTLKAGDSITYTNGKDRMEDYTSKDSKIIAKSKILGTGAIHKFDGDGKPGRWSKMTGKVSGRYAEKQTEDPHNVTCHNVNVNPGTDKVLALTFDDGPSEEYTQQILDILKKYDVKATFFVIGEKLEENWGRKLVAKEDAAGHQVCTHTYDHARGAGGVDITVMSAEKQIEEVTKGQMMISQALGKEASTVVRLPGGNLTATTVRLIAPYVSAEIGWNIDTQDWQTPGSEEILARLNNASTGNVILCHDGGGDRSQTIEAIDKFIKTYKDKGYKFLTIDELIKYPEAADNDEDAFIQTSDNEDSNNSYGTQKQYSSSYGSTYNGEE